MMQRIGIAQALLGTPKLMVLDEPTSGLDPAGRRDVRDLLLSLKAAGTTVLLSSHLLAEVEQICDRVIIIDRGRLVRTGTLDELLNLGARVEIITDRLPDGMEQELTARGVRIERDVHGWRITAAIALKREIAEALWMAGSDVVSIQPLKSSLEGVFLQMVSRPEVTQ
jgi:ABC-2 type transport system ATP-binding protein